MGTIYRIIEEKKILHYATRRTACLEFIKYIVEIET